MTQNRESDPAKAFDGTWRITDMEGWDQEAYDLLGPAHFKFGAEGGTFRFVAIKGEIDGRFGQKDGKPFVEFSWSGSDEDEPTSGRGWAITDGDVLTGRIYIHRGDDSDFTAQKQPEKPTAAAGRKKRGS